MEKRQESKLSRKSNPRIRSITLLLAFFVLSAMPVSALDLDDARPVSIQRASISVKEALEQVKTQSGVYLLYQEDAINPHVRLDLDFRNMPFEQAMDIICAKAGLRYEVSNDHVLITRAPKTEAAQQQATRKVTGRVTDEGGQPLVGANIHIPGTAIGTIADGDGRFTLEVPTDAKTLEVSYVGMKSLAVRLGSTSRTLDIVLEEDLAQMEQVVVTGYQTISKERATGAFDIIPKNVLEKPTVDLSSRLVGTTAGVAATIDEDGTATFEIRGRGSFNAQKQPLLVVDGFPIEGGFETINPNDVETVSILKDAAAASIWGARAASGVIVVTTKKANKSNKLSVSFNSFLKVREKLDLDYVNPIANSTDHIAYEELMFGKYGAQLQTGAIASSEFKKVYTLAQTAMNEARLGNISEAEKERRLEELRGIDYKDDVYKYLLQNPFAQQYNLSIAGGGEKLNMYTSLMYEKDKSHFVGTSHDKYAINMRLNSQLFKWLKLDVSGMFQYNDQQKNGATLSDISWLSPYERLVNPDGSYTSIVRSYYLPAIEYATSCGMPYDWAWNPLREVRSRDLTTKTLNARLQVGLTFTLLEGLTYSPSFQYELANTKNRNLYTEDSYTVRDLVNYNTEFNMQTGEVGRSAYPTGSILENSYSEQQGYVFRNQLSFNRTFGQHEFNVVAGTEIRHVRNTSHTAPTTYGYDDVTLTTKLFPYGTGTTDVRNLYGSKVSINSYRNSYSYSTDRFFSLYGNAAYTFNGKYTLSGSVRTDASNFITDDPAYRYAPFWSVGAMWNIGKENFMKDYSFVDRLNLRMTYGFNGNVDTSTSFKPLVSYGSMNEYKQETPVSIASRGNPTLRWEKVGTFDVGVDFSLWGGKLSGKVDVYRKYSTDLIVSKSLPAIYGTSSAKVNAGEMSNKGIEIELGSELDILGNDISWYGNLTYAYNKNKVEKLYRATNTTLNYVNSDLMEGYDASARFAFEYAGLNDKGIPSIHENGTLRPMNTLFASSSDGSWTKYMGKAVAPHNFGLTTGFKVYDFDISMVFTGKFGHVFHRYTHWYDTMGTSSTSKMVLHKDISEFLAGDPKYAPLLTDESDSYQSYYGNYYVQRMDYTYHNANHIRFHELNVTYNIPQRWLRKIGFNSACVYGQINNVGILTNNEYDNDPEFPEGELKPERTYILGLKFNF